MKKLNVELKQNALRYHKYPIPGKFAIKITKPMKKTDYGLAYTPGVAEPCREIHKNIMDAYEYTNKGNLLAVISNGTAVLGLGDIGALAGKPVMEGKAILFKYLAGIDAIDIEINSKNIDEMIKIIQAIAPTFGGINLEDVAAPSCFEISKTLKKSLDIPFFHDDQEGTAVVVAAAVQNALLLVDKKIQDIKIVLSGAGAAALASADLLIRLGAEKENFYIFDSKGLLTESRNLENHKKQYAQKKDTSLKEALIDANLFIGLSKPDLLNEDDIKNMAKNPIIFAMANPIPEIMPDIVKKTRPDAIVGSGRADFPNQVNNVLCFPFLFRGGMDVRASKITINMQLACCNAIMNVARLHKNFGREKILPDAFDPILIYEASFAVADAAIKDGVARKNLPKDYNSYLDKLIYGQELEGDAIPTVDSVELNEVIRLMQFRGITKKLNKTMYLREYDLIIERCETFVKDETLKKALIITKTQKIGYNIIDCDFSTNDLQKTMLSIDEDELIGLIINDDVLIFNASQRIWFANKLCKE